MQGAVRHPTARPTVPATAPHPTEELRWREIVERLPVVAYVAEFAPDPVFRWISPQVETLLGYPPEAFLEDDDLWYRLVHPDDLARLREAERRSHDAREPFDCEYRMFAAGGRLVEVVDRDTIRSGEGGLAPHTQGVVIDVTSLRAAERRARAEVAARQRDVGAGARAVR
jgi:PAS domain S-box-containing protein